MREGGGETSLEAAFEAYFIPLYRFILLRMPGEDEAARDIAQEAFLALASGSVLGARSAFKGRSSIYTWLCAVARRKIVDRFRAESRLSRGSTAGKPSARADASGLDLLESAFDRPEEELLDREERERVRACLASLPAEQRYSLILKYIEGFSQAELARVLGKSVKAAESVLCRSRDAFSRLYEKEGGYGKR
jgi:RNA polymerase sigma-70 factor, ECF subfamily